MICCRYRTQPDVPLSTEASSERRRPGRGPPIPHGGGWHMSRDGLRGEHDSFRLSLAAGAASLDSFSLMSP